MVLAFIYTVARHPINTKGTGVNNMLASLGFGNPVLPGFWVGKGFCEEEVEEGGGGGMGKEGKGYNLFKNNHGELVRVYRITTRQDVPSVWDGKVRPSSSTHPPTHPTSQPPTHPPTHLIKAVLRAGLPRGKSLFGANEDAR